MNNVQIAMRLSCLDTVQDTCTCSSVCL